MLNSNIKLLEIYQSSLSFNLAAAFLAAAAYFSLTHPFTFFTAFVLRSLKHPPPLVSHV